MTCYVNGNLISVYYRAGGGGKFIQNILGLSRHCVLKKYFWAIWDCNQDCFDSKYYQQKLAWALSTIPPTTDQSWMNYELSDGEFYGDVARISPITQHVADSGRYATVSEHFYEDSENPPMVYSQHHRIALDPCDQFADHWFRIKNPTAPAFIDDQRPEFPPGLEMFKFDVDNTIYDQARFLNQCQQMYAYLGWEDFSSDLVAELHQAYVKWHRDFKNTVSK